MGFIEEEEQEIGEEKSSGGGDAPPEKKRRLGAEQVRELERSFKAESKLDPGRKARLACELGLEPRQVAVWFQNRRARWKAKRLELDFGSLRAKRDALEFDVGVLRRETSALAVEAAELRDKLAARLNLVSAAEAAAEPPPPPPPPPPSEERSPSLEKMIPVGLGAEEDVPLDCTTKKSLFYQEVLEDGWLYGQWGLNGQY